MNSITSEYKTTEIINNSNYKTNTAFIPDELLIFNKTDYRNYFDSPSLLNPNVNNWDCKPIMASGEKASLEVDNFQNLQSRDKKVEKTTVIKEYCFLDQIFTLEFEDNNFYLTHTRWSLVGMGRDLFEAEIDLLKEIKSLAMDLIHTKLKPTDYEDFEFIDFVKNNC